MSQRPKLRAARLFSRRVVAGARPGAARLLRRMDLAATFVFALGGASAAVDADLDVFGVLVIAFASSLVGGIVRDVLLGETPPAALRGVWYPSVAFGAGALVTVVGTGIHDMPDWLVVALNAAGLGLFAVTGALKSHQLGLNYLAALLLGTVSAAGGGVVRDVLLNQVPVVLRVEIYAVAAALGAAVTLAVVRLGKPRGLALGLGLALCFALRVIAAWQHWNLPTVIELG